MHALLLHAAAEDAEDARRNLDAALAADAAALKNALLKALRSCALHRAFLGLPALLEETRRLLTAASAKLVATTLETELCADVEACEDARALGCVVEVLNVLLGSGKLEELGGFDLTAPAKKSCRTASTRRRAGSRRRSSSSAARIAGAAAAAGRRRRAYRRPRRPAGGPRGGGGARGGARRRSTDVRAGDGGEGAKGARGGDDSAN